MTKLKVAFRNFANEPDTSSTELSLVHLAPQVESAKHFLPVDRSTAVRPVRLRPL